MIFTELLTRFPTIRAVGAPTYASSPMVNSIEHQLCNGSDRASGLAGQFQHGVGEDRALPPDHTHTEHDLRASRHMSTRRVSPGKTGWANRVECQPPR